MRYLAGMMIAALVVACSKDSSSPTLDQNGARGASAPVNGTDTSGSGGQTTPPTAPEQTSNGPVATVELSPKSLNLSVGYYGHIDAIPRDAAGIRVANKRPTWTSDDANIAIASDTGVIYGKAAGSTTVRATIDGHTEAAVVTVTTARAVPPPPPAQPGVASFDLTATIAGSLAGTDTSRTEIVAGATVHLTRSGGVNGDTLATPVDAGTALSNSQGVVSFKGLAGGWYTLDITPPAGSAYSPMHTGFGPPYVVNVQTTFVLRRK